MDCISYDHEFLAHTVSKLKSWTPARGEKKIKGGKKGPAGVQSDDDSEGYVD